MDRHKEAPHPDDDRRNRRPFLLFLSGMTLAAVSAAGWLRFTAALQNKAYLAELEFKPSLQWYLILSGLFTGLILLPALWGLLRHLAWTPLAALLGAGLVLTVYWFERLVLWDPSKNLQNWGFMLILSLLWFGLLLLAFTLPSNRHQLKQTASDEKRHK